MLTRFSSGNFEPSNEDLIGDGFQDNVCTTDTKNWYMEFDGSAIVRIGGAK